MNECRLTALLETALAAGATQEGVANLYARGLRSPGEVDWPRVNQMILARWPKGLVRVKRRAWAIARDGECPTWGGTAGG